jgi:5-methylcytosine-specific restriction endonuclease McrA
MMPQVTLWRADAHQWGPGKVHVLSADLGRTLCGFTRERCPGTIVTTHEIITEELEIEPAQEPDTRPNCEKCLKATQAAERRVQYEREYQERQRQKQEADRLWWAEYNRYLDSAQWSVRREAVLRRAQGICEGCGKNRATMVHHLTYARVTREMLFDLVAICKTCHEQVHGEDRGR